MEPSLRIKTRAHSPSQAEFPRLTPPITVPRSKTEDSPSIGSQRFWVLALEMQRLHTCGLLVNSFAQVSLARKDHAAMLIMQSNGKCEQLGLAALLLEIGRSWRKNA